jgi:DNA-binding winged helix-turn-helix (wHTH) protein
MRVRFGEFTLDSATRQVLRSREAVPLSTKAFDVLHLLLERRPGVVSKTDLHERIWPRTFVVDANLSVLIAEIRKVLDDDARTPRFVRTVHRVGYAFFGATVDLDEPVARGAGDRRCWLVWDDQTFPLVDGDNVVGRDPRSAVWVDASGVSRRHARIRVADDQALLEDLGSRNGTLLREANVTAPTSLEDGDVIRVGSVTLKFRMWSAERAPQTERLPRS